MVSIVHDFDAAWKTVLEVFEKELVEVIFPEIYVKIDWMKGVESLDKELEEIQKEIFNREDSQKIISDKIIKVRLKNNEEKILLIHVEVQSYSHSNNIFAERMFRYFYRIWDKFRYKYNDKSEIIAAAIYTYKGNRGKDKKYIYNVEDINEDILTYNFRTIDIEKLNIDDINNNNPLKLVFKIAKKLLYTGTDEEAIYNAKIKLLDELSNYDKVKTDEEAKALAYFLEYLFLIEDENLNKKYIEYKDRRGGVAKMSVDEIRELYLIEKGIKKGKTEGKLEGKDEGIKLTKKVFKLFNQGESISSIAKICNISEEEVNEILE